MTEQIEKRIVLVTGGTGALGRWVVENFVEAGHGVHVPVFDPKEKAELREFLGEAAGRVVFHDHADLTAPEVVSRVFSEVRQLAGRGPEILLNLAGGFATAPIEKTDPVMWSRILAANATSAFLCSRAAFAEMKDHGWGRVVNVSALPALEGGGAGLSAYAAAKSAVLALTRTLSREGAGHGITVNALLPSVIDTPANRAAMPEADPSTWVPPSEIAALCAFVASDEARSLTGAALTLRLD